MEGKDGADGGRVVRVSRCSCDLYSRNYSGTLTRRDLACWYDVHPFSLTLWPHHFCENVRRGAWWIKKLNYAYIAVELLLDGEVIYEQAGKKFHLSRPGEIFLTCPGSDIRFRSGKNRYARQLQLIISGGTIKLLLESLGMNFCGVILPETPSAFEDRLRRIGTLLREKRPGTASANSVAGFELLAALADEVGRQKRPELPPLLTRAVTLIETERGNRMNVSRLVEELGISRAGVDRLFRTWLHISPQQYLIRQRMESACQQIRDGQLSFKEIAELLGFRNAFYFSTAFRKYSGQSPSEFRRGGARESGRTEVEH